MSQIQIATFNINSLRVRLQDLCNWLLKENIDIIGLQETKVQDPDFPWEPLQQIGYHATFRGEKGKNGVAILSKEKPISVTFGLDEWGADGEARLIAAKFSAFTIVNTYVPQGREVGTDYFNYKLEWLRHMGDYFRRHHEPNEPLLWLGDFNVAPDPLDVYDPKRLAGRVGFHPAEQEALASVREWGFTDIFRKHCPTGGLYTFWDYRIKDALPRGLGWRIDHIYATAPLAAASQKAFVATELRQTERPSDHAPLVATFHL
ncbi:MAG: exodeoxyribonuclease III [Sporomusaceae bacterium]|nr:exodeoxyribonuclease III [Sporomusaceae bacterium]